MKIWLSMAESLSEIFERMLQKQGVVIEKYQALQEKCERLMEENSSLSAELEEQKKEIQQLKLENDYLKIARSIAPDRETLENSRRLIAKLVRDVDKCIEQLNE